MRTRCNNPNRLEYTNYGGRGITICKEWDNFQNFEEWALENGYEDNLTLDRVDNDKGYSPTNCKWSTMKEQSNNKRNNIVLLCNGKEYTPLELSASIGVSVNTIYDAHRNQGITDFTDYKPRHSEHKNIFKRKYSYEVTIKGKHIGSYKTLEDAIRARDNVLSTVCEVTE